MQTSSGSETTWIDRDMNKDGGQRRETGDKRLDKRQETEVTISYAIDWANFYLLACVVLADLVNHPQKKKLARQVQV